MDRQIVIFYLSFVIYIFQNSLIALFHPAALYLFTNKKSLDWSKLKALADDKITVTEKLKSIFG